MLIYFKTHIKLTARKEESRVCFFNREAESRLKVPHNKSISEVPSGAAG